MEFYDWLGQTLKNVLDEKLYTASTSSTVSAEPITVERMRRAVEDIMFMQEACKFAGYEVVVVPDHIEHRPNLQLSQATCEVLSPEMVEATNAWMLEFFGTTTVVHSILKDDAAVIHEQTRQVFMNPRMYERFQKAMADYRR